MKEYELIDTDHFDQLNEVMGRRYMKSKIENSLDFINIASEGLSANVIRNFRNYFDLSVETTAQMLNVSEPSVYRWTKANKKLDKNIAIKLFEISELFLLGSEVFGSKVKFFKWLDLPNTALGGIQPKGLIEVPEGISKLKDLLGRIEHGVFS